MARVSSLAAVLNGPFIPSTRSGVRRDSGAEIVSAPSNSVSVPNTGVASDAVSGTVTPTV